MAICERCAKKTKLTKMSYFDKAMLCPMCWVKEAAHPRFHDAIRADEAAIRQGNFNFGGIGKPADL